MVTSAAGLGKTALVVRWAHSVADRFPDGQVFLDLRGHDSRQRCRRRPRSPGARRARHRPEEDAPDCADLLARYRTVLNGRRVLIVADNAGSVTQVAPLVPPTSDSQLVVTERRRLAGLSTQHAVRELTVAPLPRDAARDLLRRILGQDRLRDPALDDVLRWCGGWPLALRHVAAKLAARPGQPVASFLEELHAVTGWWSTATPEVSTVYSTDTLRCVSPAAARLFGRLRRVSDGMTLAMAAATADAPAHEARVLLDELVATHLLVEDRSGWFRCHDVVAPVRDRAHARRPRADHRPDAASCGGFPADLKRVRSGRDQHSAHDDDRDNGGGCESVRARCTTQTARATRSASASTTSHPAARRCG